MALEGTQGQQENNPQGRSTLQASSVTQSKSHGQTTFKGIEK